MIVGCAEADVPADWRRQVLAIQDEAWPPNDRQPSVALVHDPDLEPWSLLLVIDDEVVAALDVLSKSLEHRGHIWRAMGLATVVTAAGQRGRGYGRQLVVAALEYARGRGADVVLFSCDRPLVDFYRSCGCEEFVGSVLIGRRADDPLRSDDLDKVVLGLPLSESARLRRSDFVGAEIGLYSGVVDQLW